jgi:hypothetical protein
MAGVADCDQARTLWRDTNAPVHRRCLAARALGLLAKHGPSWLVEDAKDDESRLGRARRHASKDNQRRRLAESKALQKEEALDKMRQLGAGSVADVIRILQDKSASSETREAAAYILRRLRCRDAVEALIDALGEGHERLSDVCMEALTAIGSRRNARRLIDIVRGDHPLPARQKAIYTLWQLQETRAEQLSFASALPWIRRRSIRETWRRRPLGIPRSAPRRKERLQIGFSILPSQSASPHSARAAQGTFHRFFAEHSS